MKKSNCFFYLKIGSYTTALLIIISILFTAVHVSHAAHSEKEQMVIGVMKLLSCRIFCL
ncbi:hypothetical protein QUF70_09695 [Desulfobacterales bacterium HSG17]|nr:hypothetical protein [Desulfobacterales bacterium HSG17]